MPRNSLLPTSDQFRESFPEFTDATRYPNTAINFYLSMADDLLDQDRFGDKFVYLAELMTAHYVELRGKRTASAAQGGVNTSGGGVATSKSVDKVSISYDVSGIINPDAGFGITPIMAESFSGGGRCLAWVEGKSYEKRD